MDQETKEIYSEVYSILNLLGNNFINKLPKILYKMIEKEKSNSYNPQYSLDLKLEEQNIKKESLSMIALFHLNYWTETEEEKKEIRKIFLDNEQKYQSEIKEKYNPNNLFKTKKIQFIQEEQIKTNEVSIIEYKEENIFKRFINNVLRFLKK